MPNLRDDLRSTADAVRAEARDIERLEAEKAELEPDDPRVSAISGRVELLAKRLERKASAERELSERIDASTTRDSDAATED